MSVSYKKLWKLLIDKDMKKKDLREAAAISTSSMAKLLNLIKIYLDVISLIGKAAILTRMYWMEPNGSLMLHLITVQQLSVMAVMPIHPIGKN